MPRFNGGAIHYFRAVVAGKDQSPERIFLVEFFFDTTPSPLHRDVLLQLKFRHPAAGNSGEKLWAGRKPWLLLEQSTRFENAYNAAWYARENASVRMSRGR